jgi:hypothetical protein
MPTNVSDVQIRQAKPVDVEATVPMLAADVFAANRDTPRHPSRPEAPNAAFGAWDTTNVAFGARHATNAAFGA